MIAHALPATAAITAVLFPAFHAPAEAPSPIASAYEAQTAIGYRPCRPQVTPLPADLIAEGVYADADNGEQSGNCEIRMSAALQEADLTWVAWHEVCHLSTVSAIYADPTHARYADPAHEHPFFRQCLRFGPAYTGGY